MQRTTPLSTLSRSKGQPKGTSRTSRYLESVHRLRVLNEPLLIRSAVSCTLASHWRTRTWTLNWSVSMPNPTSPKDSVSSRAGSCSGARCRCVDCTHAVYSILARSHSSQHSRRLLDPSHFLLPRLGQKFPLEVAVGVNGRVWIDAKDSRKTIAVARCIEACDPDQYGITSGRRSRLPLTVDGVGNFLAEMDVA